MTRRILYACLLLAFLFAAIPAHAQVPSAFPYVKPIQNDSSVGTTQFTLTKINSSGNAVIMATSDTNGYAGVCVSNCGKTGTAWIAFAGLVPLTVDGTATDQHYITISSTTGGDGHDSGAATYPTSGAVIGRVQAGATSGNLAMVDLFSAEIQAVTGGGGAGPNFLTPISATPNSGTTTSAAFYADNSAGIMQQPLNCNTNTAGTSLACATKYNIKAGESAVFAVMYASGSATITSTGPNDSLGNAVTCGTPVTPGVISMALCTMTNSASGGAVDTFTITVSASVSNMWIAGGIYSGTVTSAMLDGSVVSASANSSAPSSGPYTSTNANDAIVTFIGDVNFLNTYSFGGSFNERAFDMLNGVSQNGGIIFGDQLVSSTGSFTGSLTLPAILGGRWIAMTVGLKLSAAPATADVGGFQTPDTYSWLTSDFWGNTRFRKLATNPAYFLAGPGGLPGAINVLQGQPLACAIITATTSNCIDLSNGTMNVGANISNQSAGYSLKTGPLNASSYATQTNCTSTASPAVCGSAAAGIVQVAAAGTSLVINTSAVTANSRIQFIYSTVGITAPTNIASMIPPYVSAITAGTSFTISLPVAPATNPVNIMYFVVN